MDKKFNKDNEDYIKDDQLEETDSFEQEEKLSNGEDSFEENEDRTHLEEEDSWEEETYEESEYKDNQEDYYEEEDSVFVTNIEEEKEKENEMKELEVVKQEIIDAKEEDKGKKKKKTNVILLIGVVVLLVFLLSIIVLKLITNSTSVPEDFESISELEEGEDISVEKAKEIVEKANVDLDKLKENNNISTAIPQLPDEDSEVEIETGPKEYSNSSLGVSFTYPSDWVEILSFESKETADNVTNTVMVGVPPDSGKIDNMRISIEETMVDITSKTYFEKTEGLLETLFPKFQLVNKGEMTVSGREAPTRTYLWVPQEELDKSPYEQEWVRVKQLQIYVAGKEKIYVVTFTANEEDFDKNFEKYQEVLNTLDLQY